MSSCTQAYKHSYIRQLLTFTPESMFLAHSHILFSLTHIHVHSQPNSPVVRILQLTDFHWDPKYRPGLSNKCGEPLCCREGNEQGIFFSSMKYYPSQILPIAWLSKLSPSLCVCAGNGSTAAGYWGDYNCDVPFHTLENLFQYLATIKDQVHHEWL